MRGRHLALAGPGVEHLVDQAEGLGFVGLEELAAGLVDPSYLNFSRGAVYPDQRLAAANSELIQYSRTTTRSGRQHGRPRVEA